MLVERIRQVALVIIYRVMQQIKDVDQDMNGALANFSQTQVLIGTIIALLILRRILHMMYEIRRIGIKAVLFRAALKLPFVKQRVQQENDKYASQYWAQYLKQRTDCIKEIPAEAMSPLAIQQRMKKGEEFCRKAWIDGGRISGAVYHPEDKHWDFVCDIMRQYIVVNPLHCEEFLPVTQMEAEIIRMVCNLYKGDSSTCGIGTGGGTESILLGMLAHREWAKNERGVVYPNIVVSETAHVAFEKAGFYFGIEVRKVPVNADLSANVAGMKKQIDSNTVCLVASACEYPFGNIDPVPEIAALALRYDVGCHVDACLGGFINPFAEEAGFPLPCIVDFRNPGVTSISVDTHKYAYGPKGYSVCMFKNAALRNSQLFSAMQWQGGFYTTPAMAGSRAGSIIAGTWAAICKIGHSKYVEYTRDILTAAANIRHAVKSDIPEITLGSEHNSPTVSLVTRPGADQMNCIALADVLLKHYGWTLSKTQRPSGCHLSITVATCYDWQDFINAVKQSIQMMKDTPALNHSSNVATYGMAAAMPDSTILDKMCQMHTTALLDALP